MIGPDPRGMSTLGPRRTSSITTVPPRDSGTSTTREPGSSGTGVLASISSICSTVRPWSKQKRVRAALLAEVA